jgi:hypothetical protein
MYRIITRRPIHILEKAHELVLSLLGAAALVGIGAVAILSAIALSP